MSPTSKILLALVALAAAALFVTVARSHKWLVQVPAAVLAFVLSVATGVLIVNDYYDYYTSWSAAVADLSGGGTSYALGHALTPAVAGATGAAAAGRLMSIDLPGPRSGIDRRGLVYLPPQYFEKTYRNVRFPAVELLHGTPGDPAQWVNLLRVTELAEDMIHDRQMGPMVLVMPDSNGGVANQEECLNTPAFHDDTYISSDVPTDIEAHLRVSRDSAQWGMIGVSSGGYCAANLMLRHPRDYGSAASIDGYYRPDVENAAAIIGSNTVLSHENDPLATALAHRPGAGPLPAFWVAAGTGDPGDYAYADPMVDAMRRLESVPFLVVPGARHTMPAVRGMLPSALAWTWQQLAAPDQRRAFPTVSLSAGQTVRTAPLPHWLVHAPRITHRDRTHLHAG